MALKPEDLPYRVTIEQPTFTENELGERIAGPWSTWQRLWAGVKPISAREAEFAKSFAETVTHKIRLRYIADLSPTFRVNFKGRTFSIDGVVNVDEAGIELNLFCTEKVA